MRFRCIQDNRGAFSVRMMCRVLGVSESGFYASQSCPVSCRAQQNKDLKTRIIELHEASDGVYGSPRIFKDLLEEGFAVGRHRIARIMKKAGIVGVTRRKRQSLTKRDERRPAAPNVLEQDFEATAPNQKWAADITYVRTHEGFVYLAVVLDLFSRRVVGWAMSTSLETTIAGADTPPMDKFLPSSPFGGPPRAEGLGPTGRERSVYVSSRFPRCWASWQIVA